MPIRATLVALALTAAGAADSASAQTAAPLSAIDWLSDSIALPAAVPRPGRSGPSEPQVVETARPDPVTVTPLDAPRPDTIGLYPPAAAGLPDDLWRASGMPTVGRLLAESRELHLPAAQRLLRDLLEVGAAPPTGSADGSEMFLARVDALLALGALDAARGLLDRADQETPEHFRRWFDIALLTGRENRACARMRALPRITPTYPARIFCLARGGDWMAAALTLDTAEALDVVSAAETERLDRFLDDLDGAGSLPPPRVPSPLDFAIFEAIGEPLRTATLPLAFAHADLRDNTGWKARIEAAERLARAGAIGHDRLWDIYHEREPAASGGVWDRLSAVLALDAAIADRDGRAVAATLPDAWTAMQAAELGHLLAAHHGARLCDMALDGRAGDIAFRMGLVSGRTPGTAGCTSATPGASFLADLAAGAPRADRASSPVQRAVLDGFSSPAPARLHALLEAGRVGEALLAAVDRLEAGAAGNLDALRDGLAILREAGQEDRAVDAALELLVLERRA